ncbi:MAG TPA: Gfo/Idh/MocA family oxidoreductase [Lacipirellulaceae bacterium]|jgi:predicted dehydrogenase|nr:Gfo/Idh/MocA family oxidoreductase [Lacipirellulaceae bacterium]
MTARYRALVIGAGSIGERHIRCFLATERADVAICEPNATIRNVIRERYGTLQSFECLDDALSESFDLAIVATPAPLHILQARLLVEKGIRPLVEKPLSLNLDGIVELDRAASRRRLVAGVAYPYRAHPALAAMRDAIASSRFGQTLEVIAVAGQHFPTYRPAYRDIYYRDRATGGGAIQDALTHLINAVEWVVGPTTSVVADAAHLRLEGVTVEDTVHVLARNTEVATSYALNQHQPANELTVTVICERGQARFEAHRAKWSWITDVDGDWRDAGFTLDRDTLFRRQAEAFLDAIEARQSPLCSINEGAATVKTVLAILASLESRRWEQIRAAGPELAQTKS